MVTWDNPHDQRKPDIFGGMDLNECPVMVPVFELWNHHDKPNCMWGFGNTKDGSLIIKTAEKIKKGSELFLRYRARNVGNIS